MPKKTTRRSISVKGTTYARLQRHCKATGVSVSGFAEALINARLDEANVPEVRPEELQREPEAPRPRRPLPRTAPIDPGASIFTF